MKYFKKRLVKWIAMAMGALFACSFVACGGNGSAQDDGKITMFKWDFSSLNAAKRSNTAIYAKMKEKAKERKSADGCI